MEFKFKPFFLSFFLIILTLITVMSYLDIDVILSEEDRVKCTFTLDAQDLGKLDKDTKTDYLAEGTELELPLWMAETLLEKNMITAELPKQYNQTMRDALQAGAASVRLFEHSFYFFEVGVKLAKDTEDKDLKRNLMQAFSGERFRNLMNHSLSRLIIYLIVILLF